MSLYESKIISHSMWVWDLSEGAEVRICVKCIVCTSSRPLELNTFRYLDRL